MLTGKKLGKILFGRTFESNATDDSRVATLNIPAANSEDFDRKYIYRADDGFILELIKMIERLQMRVAKLEREESKKSKK